MYRIQHKKRVEAEKNGDQNGKALFKVMKNAICGKTMENLKNRIDEKLVNNKKDYWRCTLKPSFMSQNTFENN